MKLPMKHYVNMIGSYVASERVKASISGWIKGKRKSKRTTDKRPRTPMMQSKDHPLHFILQERRLRIQSKRPYYWVPPNNTLQSH